MMVWESYSHTLCLRTLIYHNELRNSFTSMDLEGCNFTSSSSLLLEDKFFGKRTGRGKLRKTPAYL